jgi:hypothetical protein
MKPQQINANYILNSLPRDFNNNMTKIIVIKIIELTNARCIFKQAFRLILPFFPKEF